jgi:hypothetical protein
MLPSRLSISRKHTRRSHSYSNDNVFPGNNAERPLARINNCACMVKALTSDALSSLSSVVVVQSAANELGCIRQGGRYHSPGPGIRRYNGTSRQQYVGLSVQTNTETCWLVHIHFSIAGTSATSFYLIWVHYAWVSLPRIFEAFMDAFLQVNRGMYAHRRPCAGTVSAWA